MRWARQAGWTVGLVAIALAGALVVEVAAVGRAPDPPVPRPGAQRERHAVLIAAGDIADCGLRGDSATAALVRAIPGVVATLGDHVYDNGSKREFAECYGPTWGTERKRTRPAPGNHDYETRGAAAYFAYFGAAAGDPDTGYYSYDLGAWHIVALNSNCGEIGGCGAGSRQMRWLHRDLAAHPATCTLAYWHHPLFSSGEEHGGSDAMKTAWATLYADGADVVLASHEHNYERFAPQDAEGRPDRRRGIRQFVVGTGGAGLYGFARPLATSQVRNDETHGVLVLTLRPSGYDWAFVPAASRTDRPGERPFVDAGRAECH